MTLVRRSVPAILWAHRGASAIAPENTLEAFELAVRLGATGLESDVHLSIDGVPVLVHDARIRRDGKSIVIGRRTAEELATWQIPTLAGLYRAVGTALPLSLDLNDTRVEATADAVIEVARSAGGAGAVRRLYLCLGDLRELESLAARQAGPVWVHSANRTTVLGRHGEHARRLADHGIGVLNLKWPGWGGKLAAPGAIEAVHAAGLRAFAWDTQLAPVAERMLRAGVDGVYADDPRELLRAARDAASGSGALRRAVRPSPGRP